jgi:hypothetical protein
MTLVSKGEIAALKRICSPQLGFQVYLIRVVYERVLEVPRICYGVSASSLHLAVTLQLHASSGQVTNYLIFPEDGGSKFLQCGGTYLPNYNPSHPIRS